MTQNRSYYNRFCVTTKMSQKVEVFGIQPQVAVKFENNNHNYPLDIMGKTTFETPMGPWKDQ